MRIITYIYCTPFHFHSPVERTAQLFRSDLWSSQPDCVTRNWKWNTSTLQEPCVCISFCTRISKCTPISFVIYQIHCIPNQTKDDGTMPQGAAWGEGGWAQTAWNHNMGLPTFQVQTTPCFLLHSFPFPQPSWADSTAFSLWSLK